MSSVPQEEKKPIIDQVQQHQALIWQHLSPYLEQSDHVSLVLTPAYRPLISMVKPTARVIQV